MSAAKSTTDEADALLAEITALERENRSLRGYVMSVSAEALAQARKTSAELASAREQVEKALALGLLARKTPKNTASLADHYETLKTEVLAYCADNKIEPSLWKKLESL